MKSVMELRLYIGLAKKLIWVFPLGIMKNLNLLANPIYETTAVNNAMMIQVFKSSL